VVDKGEIFKDRNKRDQPVFVEPGQLDKGTGLVDSFTILFQHVASFTFSMSLSKQIQAKNKEEKRKQYEAR
jgi:hypothetical protein